MDFSILYTFAIRTHEGISSSDTLRLNSYFTYYGANKNPKRFMALGLSSHVIVLLLTFQYIVGYYEKKD